MFTETGCSKNLGKEDPIQIFSIRLLGTHPCKYSFIKLGGRHVYRDWLFQESWEGGSNTNI